MAKKTAMVQPVPKKPSSRAPVETQHAASPAVSPAASLAVSPAASPPASLEEILHRMGKNRAYTVISHKGNAWLVHFEGDSKPTTITVED